ncbi:hypothetical protein NIASO_02140 [Niabella soli DSM 19437]|uniref:Uncharacterized protein n=1 Tax=Niabella soli DSM 19437 TaxID=929713 RepID=W0F293_9BACT|nr:hypothetical protein NIASO_02140 [Niabella soli DSM 19437]
MIEGCINAGKINAQLLRLFRAIKIRMPLGNNSSS